MSNALINFHIEDGSPMGVDATLDDISDYYGEKIAKLVDEVLRVRVALGRSHNIIRAFMDKYEYVAEDAREVLEKDGFETRV